MAKTSKIGIAGEYALVSELIKRGYVACVTDKNTPKFDVLASNQEGTKFAAIQVKTSGGDYNGDFVMTKKDEDWFHNDNGEFGRVFYAFVRLNDVGNTYWFISALEVAKCVDEEYKLWLNDPTAKRKRKDTTMRTIKPQKSFPDLKDNNFEVLDL